jgi:low affinity Fe/Cu permease
MLLAKEPYRLLRLSTGMAVQSIARFLTLLGVWTSTPWAFGIFTLYIVFWFVVERHTLDLHGIATLATWFMTLCIQRAGHRDTQAIHAKLDELLRTQNEASNELTTLDDEEPEVIEKHREDMRDETPEAQRDGRGQGGKRE